MAEREHIQYPSNIAVETKFGKISVSVTNGRHIYAETSWNGEGFAYRGANYHSALHLEPSTEPGSVLRTCWIPMLDQSKELFTCRKTDSKDLWERAPKTYAAAIKAEMVRAINEWATVNEDVFLRAEYIDAYNEVTRTGVEVTKAEAALQAARDVRNKASARLHEITLRLPAWLLSLNACRHGQQYGSCPVCDGWRFAPGTAGGES